MKYWHAGERGPGGDHLIALARLGDGDVGIVTILHERMHQIDGLKDDHLG
ncbi:hypothetical protein [Actibacterium sp. D379-3]